MNLEKLNKILPYCGYGVKANNEGYIVDVAPSHCGTDLINAEMLCTPNRDGSFCYLPMLFPPDCLTKEIETEHGKEIPLIELAKIATNLKNGWVINGDMAKNNRLLFWYEPNKFCLLRNGIWKEMENQWHLFQYLYSRHIAFNLDPGEYVNVESLEVNPYK